MGRKTEKSWFNPWQRQEIFHFSKASRPGLVPIPPTHLLRKNVTCNNGAGVGLTTHLHMVKVKVIPQQAEVTQGVLGRLRPRIVSTFSTTRVVGCQPYAPATFPQKKSLVLIFKGGVDTRARGSIGRSGKNPVTPPGIDPRTV